LVRGIGDREGGASVGRSDFSETLFLELTASSPGYSEMQLALTKAECKRIFTDKLSSVQVEPPG
jgi:hypothetical protein